MPKISIVIKALNEEQNIARAIESSLEALADLDGEVILSDSLSSDRTIEIAASYPIKIVQMTSVSDRGCGSGAQLGYQASLGEYIYMLDADMRFRRGFLLAAIAELEREPSLAGVGGLVNHLNVTTLAIRLRTGLYEPHMQPGYVDRLDMGGLYRRAAIEDVGYLADRNLRAYEELELALRLTNKGWRLKRLDMVSVDHDDHKMSDGRLMLLRWSTGYAAGPGELLRAAIGKPFFVTAITKVRLIQLSVLIYLWFFAIAALIVSGLPYSGVAAATLAVLPFLVMVIKKRDFRLGVHAVMIWMMYAVGLPRGFCRRRKDPLTAIPLRSVKSMLDS